MLVVGARVLCTSVESSFVLSHLQSVSHQSVNNNESSLFKIYLTAPYYLVFKVVVFIRFFCFGEKKSLYTFQSSSFRPDISLGVQRDVMFIQGLGLRIGS